MAENRQKKWRHEDDEVLREYGALRSPRWIAKQIGRTPNGVERRLERLGILNKHAETGTYSANELASIIGTDAKTVIKWIKERGLSAQQGSYFRQWAYEKRTPIANETHKPWFIVADDFWKWAENNKQRLNFSRFEHGDFINEPPWVEEERKKRVKLPKTKTLWTEEEDALAWKLYYTGHTQKEIAQILKRSLNGVEKRIKRLREQHLSQAVGQ